MANRLLADRRAVARRRRRGGGRNWWRAGAFTGSATLLNSSVDEESKGGHGQRSCYVAVFQGRVAPDA